MFRCIKFTIYFHIDNTKRTRPITPFSKRPESPHVEAHCQIKRAAYSTATSASRPYKGYTARRTPHRALNKTVHCIREWINDCWKPRGICISFFFIHVYFHDFFFFLYIFLFHYRSRHRSRGGFQSGESRSGRGSRRLGGRAWVNSAYIYYSRITLFPSLNIWTGAGYGDRVGNSREHEAGSGRGWILHNIHVWGRAIPTHVAFIIARKFALWFMPCTFILAKCTCYTIH